VYAVEAGALARANVTELGAVLDGGAQGRYGYDEITVFDSTGLAIQDLAVALAVLRRYDTERDGFPDLDTVDAG
jgi:alanine dehydrogenase